MTVAAQDLANVGEAEEQIADALASQVSLGEIPLAAVRRREQLAKGEVMDGGKDLGFLTQRRKLSFKATE